MKKFVFTAAIICFAAFTTSITAQDDKGVKGDKGDKGKKETQEIIIRKKGEKDTKITVEIKELMAVLPEKQRQVMHLRDIEGFSFFNDANGEPRAFLGVTTEDVEDGAKIQAVNKGSAAEKAGLKEGDIITKVGDKKVDGPETLSEAVTSMKPKDDVKIYFKRDGKENSVTAVLGERNDSNAMSYSFSGPDGMSRSFTMPRIQSVPRMDMKKYKELEGMSPKVWSPEGGDNYDFFSEGFPRHQKLGLKIQDTEDGKGVKVLDVDKDSPAEKAGLKKDDIVTEIGDKKVSNTDEAREQLMDSMEKSSYSIKANRNGNAMSFDIKIPKKLKTANL